MAHKHVLQPAYDGGLYCQILGCAFELSDHETADVFTQLLKACKAQELAFLHRENYKAHLGLSALSHSNSAEELHKLEAKWRLAQLDANCLRNIAIAAAKGKDGE